MTPLTARMFGVWNLTSAMIRVYAALNIHDKRCVVAAVAPR